VKDLQQPLPMQRLKAGASPELGQLIIDMI
jgi:hypothetical protein